MSEVINNLVDKLKLASDGETAVKGLATEFYRELVTECTGMVRDDADMFLGTFETAYRSATFGWKVNGKACRIDSEAREIELQDGGRYMLDHEDRALMGRKAYKISNAPLPTAYRSAKSTILAAIDAGVELSDENGEPMAKAALSKASKSAADPFADKLATLVRTVNALAKIQDKGEVLTAAQCVTIGDEINRLAAIIDENEARVAALAAA